MVAVGTPSKLLILAVAATFVLTAVAWAERTPRASADPDAVDLAPLGAADALLPAPRFAFSYAPVVTGVSPPGLPQAVPAVPLAAYQTAVARRAIPPHATPDAVPRTPLAVYQTAVAQRALPPNATPNAVPAASPVLIGSPLPTPPLPLLPGIPR